MRYCMTSDQHKQSISANNYDIISVGERACAELGVTQDKV